MSIKYEIYKITDKGSKKIGETSDVNIIDKVIKRFTQTKDRDDKTVTVWEHGEKIADFYTQPGRPNFASAAIFINALENK